VSEKDYESYLHHGVAAMNGFEELTLELTDWCPAECLHCSSNSSPACDNRLPEDLALKLVEEVASIGARKVSFGGGEPVASESFPPVVARVAELGMCAEVFTCGVAGDGETLNILPAEVLNFCKGLPRVKFIFSVHGATADMHDYFAQTPGSFELMKASLAECLSAGIECEMNFVPTRVNFGQFEGVVELAEEFGLKRLSILRFVPQGRGHDNREELELYRDEEDLFVERLLALRPKTTVDLRTGSPFNGIVPMNAIPCRAGISKLVVQADGNVLPCEVFKQNERCKWNLSVYDQSLTQILRSPQLAVLSDLLKNSNYLECPIHSALRPKQKPGTVDEHTKTFVHSKQR